MSLLAEPELLGCVTVPSGTLVVLDAGLINFWRHDGSPTIPAGVLSSDESEEEANNAKELRVVGPDARAAGIAFDRSCHPLYVYDVPPRVVAERIEQFAQFANEQGFDARLEPLAERVPHRQRIDQHLENGVPENGISFHGIWAAVAAGLPAGQELSVLGRRRSEGTEFEGRWHGVYIEVLPGVEIARSEMRGYAAVDEARLMFAGIDALGGWVHEDPLDGKADFVFLGPRRRRSRERGVCRAAR